MAALRPIIYNLHRLIARCPSPTPTGVDRVDFQHARFLLHLTEQEQRKIIFIRQQGSVARLVPLQSAKAIINNLEQRWQQGKDLPPAIEADKIAYILRAPETWWRQRQQKLIHSSIHRELRDSDAAPLYFHSGHGTIHHLKLHQQLKQQLRTDSIFYLHDLIPIDFPEYTNNPKALQMHRRRLETMATTGSLILANSKDSKEKFQQYTAQHGLPGAKTEVLLIGVENHMIEAAKLPLSPLPANYQAKIDSPYFITIGTIEPRKNHILLLHIWRQLAEELGKQCPKLVILGKRGWKIENIAHLLDKSPALQGNVVEVNDASDPEMIALIQHAKALLFPSFAEGWGMPLAEALTLGTPAICADIPALRECGREHASYLDPLDGPGWKQAILQIYRTEHGNQQAVNYKPDRWEDHLAQLATYVHDMDAM